MLTSLHGLPAYIVQCHTSTCSSFHPPRCVFVLNMFISQHLGSNILQPLQVGPCARLALDAVQPQSTSAARQRNRNLLEQVLLLYLYHVQGASLKFWVVAVTFMSYMPAFSRTGPKTTQKLPSTTLYDIGEIKDLLLLLYCSCKASHKYVWLTISNYC